MLRSPLHGFLCAFFRGNSSKKKLEQGEIFTVYLQRILCRRVLAAMEVVGCSGSWVKLSQGLIKTNPIFSSNTPLKGGRERERLGEREERRVRERVIILK